MTLVSHIDANWVENPQVDWYYMRYMSLPEDPRPTPEKPFQIGREGIILRKLDLPHSHKNPLSFSFVVFDPKTISLGIHSYSIHDYEGNLMTAGDIFKRDIKPELLRDPESLIEFQAVAEFIRNMEKNLPELGVDIETVGNYINQAEDIFAAQRAIAISQRRNEAAKLERMGHDLTAQTMLGIPSMDELLT